MSARAKHRPDALSGKSEAEAPDHIGHESKLQSGVRGRGSPDPAKLARAKEMARAALENMTNEEDDEITAAALADPDTPLMEEVLESNERRRLGRPPLPHTKRSVHLRLDQEVIGFFVKDGRGWQTRINAALRKAAGLK